MELRLGEKKDLPQLKKVYDRIIENMNNNNIKIWNEYYPYEIFENDIEEGNLYLLTEKKDIIAAFALFEQKDTENNLMWENNQEKVMYINRVGVNPNYLRQGIGSLVIEKAKELAKQKGAKYLRLFVVDINRPAINLYLKNGFRQVKGVHEEVTNDDVILIEYGFEIAI